MAVRLALLEGEKELLSRRVGLHLHLSDLQESLERFAHRLVIVDDGDEGAMFHDATMARDAACGIGPWS